MRKALVTVGSAVAAVGIAATPAMATAVGSNGNYINSINAHVKIVPGSGGQLARTTESITCDPNNSEYGNFYPRLQVQVSETINGRVYSGWSSVRQALPGGYWQCTGMPQSINVAAFAGTGHPAWRAGYGVVRVSMWGYDASGNWFAISKKQTVKLK